MIKLEFIIVLLTVIGVILFYIKRNYVNYADAIPHTDSLKNVNLF